MKSTLLLCLSLVGLLGCMETQARSESLAVQAPALFDNPQTIPIKVVAQCTKLRIELSNTIAHEMRKDDYAIVTGIHVIDSTTPGKSLALRFMSITAPAGGLYAGNKELHVRAELYQDGVVVASQDFDSGPLFFLGVYKNCDILEIGAKHVGSSIYKWIRETQGKEKLPATLVHVAPQDADGTRDLEKQEAESDMPMDEQPTRVTISLEAAAKVSVPSRAVIAEPEVLGQQLFDKCHLDTLTGKYVTKLFLQRIPTVNTHAGNESQGLLLKYSVQLVTNTRAPESGQKTLALHAVLLNDGHDVDVFEKAYLSKRPEEQLSLTPASISNPAAACDILDNDAKHLATAFYKWYASHYLGR